MSTAIAPGKYPPMLATLGTRPRGGGWASEFKWDGVRTVAYADRGGLVAMSRNDLDVTSQYPELADLLGRIGRRQAVFDGEIVALDQAGAPDFARLQNRMHVSAPSERLLSQIPIVFYAFDVLALDGQELIGRPYADRRDILEGLDLAGDRVTVPPAFTGGEPADVYAAALEQSLEGVVCKRLDSVYQPGRRSPSWIKVPAQRTQEVVLIGWQPGAGRRGGMIGSLLLAVPDPAGKLAYAGKVGTGFTERALRMLAESFAPLASDHPATDDVPRTEARTAQWLQPQLVGEVVFRTWTPTRRLRHTSWRGLRPDRTPESITVTGA
jgi:bifunctional non-homologous end joining protein LigD